MGKIAVSIEPSRPPQFSLTSGALLTPFSGLYIVLDPGLRIIAVSDQYLAATKTVRDQIIGR